MANTELDEVEEIARRLARSAGLQDRYFLHDGWTVPSWVTFISRAEQIIKERDAFK